jgi:flagellar biosynthesis GTPase FlhF
MIETVREHWTDDRMDDLAKRVDEGFARSRNENKELRQQIGAMGNELRRENKALAGELREENKAIVGELREENKALAGELREENKAIAAELRTENKALAAEFRQELVTSRAEVNRQFAAFTHRLDVLQGTLIAALFTAVVSLIASHFA